MASSARTAPEIRPPSGSCLACSAPTPGSRACSVAIRGPTLDCIACSLRSWRCHPVAEPDRRRVSTARRLRGGLDDKRRAALLERFDLDPKKKAERTRRGTGRRSRCRRARLRCRAAHPRRADRGPRSADGGGVSRLRGARTGALGAVCCCPAISSPMSRRYASGSPLFALAGPLNQARWRRCDTSPARRSRPS